MTTNRSLLLHRAAIAVLFTALFATASASRNADTARREAEQRARLHQADALRWRTGVDSIAIQLEMQRTENTELNAELKAVRAENDKLNATLEGIRRGNSGYSRTGKRREQMIQEGSIRPGAVTIRTFETPEPDQQIIREGKEP